MVWHYIYSSAGRDYAGWIFFNLSGGFVYTEQPRIALWRRKQVCIADLAHRHGCVHCIQKNPWRQFEELKTGGGTAEMISILKNLLISGASVVSLSLENETIARLSFVLLSRKSL